MEINFRLNNSNKGVTIHVPAGVGGFTIDVAPPPPARICGTDVEEEVKEETSNLSLLSLKVTTNPKVFFDLSVEGKPAGRIVFELFADTTPNIAEYFRVLCTGEKGKPLHYKGSIIDHVSSGYVIQGGDDIMENGGESIDGELFEDENFIKNFIKRLTGPGLLCGNDGFLVSQFIVAMDKNFVLNDSLVLFGQVIQGFDVIQSIFDQVKKVKYYTDAPNKNIRYSCPVIVISNCGQIS